MFGHRDFYGHRQLEERLIPILRDLIRKHKFIEIYMGRDGEFDTYAATIVKRVQRDYDDYHAIEFNLLLPYPKETYTDFLRDFHGFSELSCPKSVLSDALTSTIST